QCYTDQVHYDPAILNVGPGTVRAEDADDPPVETERAHVGHGHCLPIALRFIVGRPRPDWAHIPAVRFALRVDQWIAVDLRGAAEQEPPPVPEREPDQPPRPLA